MKEKQKKLLIKNRVRKIESKEERIEQWKESFATRGLPKLPFEPKSTNTLSIKEKFSKTSQIMFSLTSTEVMTELTQTNSSAQSVVSSSNFTTLSMQLLSFTLRLISTPITKRNKKIQKQKRYKRQTTQESFYLNSSLYHLCSTGSKSSNVTIYSS